MINVELKTRDVRMTNVALMINDVLKINAVRMRIIIHQRLLTILRPMGLQAVSHQCRPVHRFPHPLQHMDHHYPRHLRQLKNTPLTNGKGNESDLTIHHPLRCLLENLNVLREKWMWTKIMTMTEMTIKREALFLLQGLGLGLRQEMLE
jgi:hypothetical protein